MQIVCKDRRVRAAAKEEEKNLDVFESDLSDF